MRFPISHDVTRIGRETSRGSRRLIPRMGQARTRKGEQPGTGSRVSTTHKNSCLRALAAYQIPANRGAVGLGYNSGKYLHSSHR